MHQGSALPSRFRPGELPAIIEVFRAKSQTLCFQKRGVWYNERVFKKKRLKLEEGGGEESVSLSASESFAQAEAEGQLAIDVYQTGDEIIVESTIAGVKGEDLDIDVTSEKVTVRGERRKENKISTTDYYYQECFWGRFSRSIILPEEIDPDKAYSTLKNGVLTIHLPKVHKDKPRKVKVREA